MTKRPVRKAVPRFSSEAEERTFWETHDTSPFVDWGKARVAVFPNLKPSTETISLRLPAALLAGLKALANKRDVPYQSLLKVFLAERVDRETHAVDALSTGSPQSRKRRQRVTKPAANRTRLRG
jgi:predicted DNA binding CopG/RHH family protein